MSNIMFTVYDHFLYATMYLAIKKLMTRYLGTLCIKIHLFKVTKYFAHYIFSYIICISNDFSEAGCAPILKVKSKKSHLLCET